MADTVSNHQTCEIKIKTIQTNTHVARSVLDSCSNKEGWVAMPQVDLAKAFDWVRHDVLFRIMEHVGLGSVVLHGVKMAYQNCSTKLIINRRLTHNIPVHTHVRQGCPLSPLPYPLCLEPYCLSVMHYDLVNGCKLQSVEVQRLAYADGVAIFCADLENVSHAVSLTKTFCEASGAAVNLDKCRGVFYVTPDMYEGVRWSREPGKYFGVPLQHRISSNAYRFDYTPGIRQSTTKCVSSQFYIFGLVRLFVTLSYDFDKATCCRYCIVHVLRSMFSIVYSLFFF